MNKSLLTRLGIAGLLAWVLLQGGYSLYKNYQHNKVKEHLAKVVEYANGYMFPQALAELDTIENMSEATPEEKNLALLLKKMIVELQDSPDKAAVLSSLNDIVEQSNILEKSLVESAKKQENSQQFKTLMLRKQSILKAIEELNNTPTANMSSTERYAHEAKKLALLNELNSVMAQIQSGKTDSPKEDASPVSQEQKKQELLDSLKKLNQVNETKLNRKQRIAHRKRKQQILNQLEAIINKDPSSSPTQEARKKALLAQLKKLHNVNETKLSPKKRQALKQQRTALLSELENISNNKIPVDNTADIEKQKQEELERQKKLEEQKAAEQERQRLAKEKKQLEQEKLNLAKQKEIDAKQNQINAIKLKAKTAFADEDYNTALALYNQWEGLEPESAEVQAMKALIFSRLNRLPEANQAIQKAQLYYKGEPIVDLARAELAFSQKDTASALSMYNQVIQKGDSALALYRLGTMELRKKNTNTAIDYYNRALKASDYNTLEKNINVKLLHNIGQAYLMTNQLSTAQKFFRSALKIDSDFVPSNIALGQTYYKQKNYPSASYYLSQAIKNDPKNFTALTILGNSLHMQKDYAGAKEAMTKALALEPNNALVLYNLGSQEILLKDYTNAIIHLDSALKIQPNTNTKIQLGLALVRSRKDILRAQQLFTEAMSSNPNDLSTIKGLVEVYDAQGQFPNALKYVEQARTQNPKDTELLYKKGELLFKMRRYPDAIQTFKDLIAVDNSAENRFQLANTLLANNNSQEALTEYEAILAQKEAPEFLEGKANALIKMNRLKEAKTTLAIIATKYKSYAQITRVNQKINNISRLLPAGA